jgi:hypothetical protein
MTDTVLVHPGDFHEGVAAILEERKPRFVGR